MVDSVLFKKTLREIKENFKQYITVILIATLAVALFTGIYANWQNFSYKLDTIYELSNMADGIITTSGNTDLEREFLTDVTYEERLYLTAKVNSNDVIIASFNEESTINTPAYSTVSEIDSNTVLVDENFLSTTGLSIGDSFTVSISGLSIEIYGLTITNLELELTISGTMTHPEALDNSTFQANFIYVGEKAIASAISSYYNNLISEDYILILLPSLYNQFLIIDDNVDEILSNFSSNFEVIYALNRSNLPSNMSIEADVTQAKQLLYIFPIIFYLVAILIILTSISALINKEQKNIGLLKALGYSNLEILLHYTNIFVILCIIGGIIGMIAGPLIIPTVMNQKYSILYQLPDISTPIFRPFYLVSVLILIVIVFITAIIALAHILNKVPASSLRGDNSYDMKPTLFDKMHTKDDKFLTLKMALRNMKRKVSRTLMVILGVMGCSALLLCGFGIEDTLDNSVSTELEMIPFDVRLSYEDNGSLIDELSTIDNIVYIDEYVEVSVNIGYDSLVSSYLFILPEVSNIFVPSYQKDSCLISSKVADEIGASVGDTIYFVYNQKTYKIEITEIIDISFSQGIFISSLNDIIDLEPNYCWISTTDSSLNDSILEECLTISGISSGITIESLENQAEDKLASIRIMTNTIKIFAILLAIVVLCNLALLNFKERTKDIATLKVLGFSLHEISSSFLIEIVILTIVASACGLLLGYPLMYGVLAINQNPLLSYIYHINISSYITTFLLTAGFSTIINIVMSSFVNKVKMVESLKAVD